MLIHLSRNKRDLVTLKNIKARGHEYCFIKTRRTFDH